MCTYRLKVGWYIGWLSVNYRLTDKCVHIGWCIGRLSAYISVDYQPICQPRPPLVHMIHLLYTAIYVKEMITNLRSFDYWINSPCQYQRKCEEKSMEKMDTDVMCKGFTLYTLISVCTFYIIFPNLLFPNLLTRRTCSTIKSVFSWWSFPLFSWP